jgi:uncharacterized protein (TIGR02996 family)
MTDHEALSRAANADPTEHTPRLALHDFLEETTGRKEPTREEVEAFVGRASIHVSKLRGERVVLAAEFGRRYCRLVDGSTTYGFVDLTNGDVLMSASWKKPAKHPRGNIRDSFGELQWLQAYGVKYLR